MPARWRTASNCARVRQLLDEEGETKEAVANRLGVSVRTVYNAYRLGPCVRVVSKRKRRKGKA